jgi:hypothetical protein
MYIHSTNLLCSGLSTAIKTDVCSENKSRKEVLGLMMDALPRSAGQQSRSSILPRERESLVADWWAARPGDTNRPPKEQ